MVLRPILRSSALSSLDLKEGPELGILDMYFVFCIRLEERTCQIRKGQPSAPPIRRSISPAFISNMAVWR